MKKLLLITYGEIHLKGANRPFFMKKLKDLLKIAVSGDENARISLDDGRYYVRDYEPENEDHLVEKIAKVFGVHSLSRAYETDKDLDVIACAAIRLIKTAAQNKITFKVDTKRADKRFPMKSMDISAKIGEILLDEFASLKVDLHKPELMVYVEIRQMRAYVYTKKIMGPGGMPVGSSGRCMLLLSGGIDSPVAGYMLAKRGLDVEAIHFYSPPYTSERAKQKVIDLAGIVRDYCGPIRLHIVPFTKIQEEIYEKCDHELLTIIMRRFMMKIAESVAHSRRCEALSTGESLGQVASQTLLSLDSTNKSIDMLVLRPLICFDKIDIINISNKIGTYETSIQPFEDCCTVFTPKHPATRPKMKSIEINELKLDGEKLMDDAIKGIETILI